MRNEIMRNDIIQNDIMRNDIMQIIMSNDNMKNGFFYMKGEKMQVWLKIQNS